MQQNRFDKRMVGGIILIVLGGLFLLGPIFKFSIWGLLWPFFVIVPGLFMFIPIYNGQRESAGMAVPASIVTGTGLILLYQSLTGDWGSWAYVWTLYAVFLGVGLWLMGRTRDEAETQQTGRTFIVIGLGAFLFFWIVLGGICGGNWAWPLVLIAIGVWLLLRALGVDAAKKLDFSGLSAGIRAPSAPVAPSAPPNASIPDGIMVGRESEELQESRPVLEVPAPEKAREEAERAVSKAESSADKADDMAKQLNDEIQAAADVAQDIADMSEDAADVQRDLDETETEEEAEAGEEEPSDEENE